MHLVVFNEYHVGAFHGPCFQWGYCLGHELAPKFCRTTSTRMLNSSLPFEHGGNLYNHRNAKSDRDVRRRCATRDHLNDVVIPEVRDLVHAGADNASLQSQHN